uniref:Uncharacterized protein n=1 Tax=Oryza sativa subsp. japonica TaxID=39947 RepID=Q67W59_ORYSJ|nr:hypothetical protein [Oryza sativa Japonica Group]
MGGTAWGLRSSCPQSGVLVSAPTSPLGKRILHFIKSFASFLTGFSKNLNN